MHLGGQIPNGGTTLPEGGGAAQENGSEQSAVSVVGSFPQQQSQQPSLEEELSEEEDEDEEEEEDVTDEDSLAGRGSESGGEKAISVRGDSEEASGAEEEVGSMAAAAAAGKEIDSNEKANQQSSLPPPPPPPDCLDQPQPMEQGSSDVSGGMEEVGKPERSSSPITTLTPEREGTGTPLVEELSLQEAVRKDPGESSGRKTCEVCGQSFPTQAALEEHQKTHPKEGLLFTCIFCRQGFLERAVLKKHMLLAHHQVQPFAPHGPQNIAALSLVPGCSPSIASPGLSPFPRKDDPAIP